MTGALEVMVPVVQGMDDSEQFLIIDIIVSFSRGKCLRKVCTGMEVSVIILLHEDSSAGKERGVCHDNEGVAHIREAEYRGSLEMG